MTALVWIIALIAVLLLDAWHRACVREQNARAIADRFSAMYLREFSTAADAMFELARLRGINSALIAEADIRASIERAMPRRHRAVVLDAAEIETLRVFAGYLTMRLAEDGPDAPYRVHKQALLVIVKRMIGAPS